MTVPFIPSFRCERGGCIYELACSQAGRCRAVEFAQDLYAVECPRCRGTGRQPPHACGSCAGTGRAR